MKIYKYPLVVRDEPTSAAMPQGAEVLHVGEQLGAVCLWALVDPNAPPELRRFRIVGTGQPLEDPGRHVGTVLTAGGVLVWHVFEVTS